MESYPTPYLEVNEVLNLLLAKSSAILGSQFVGMYLYGSLSTGDFNPDSSDIDFVVITEIELSSAIISDLEIMHQNIWSSGLKWTTRLEGSYIPRNLIRRHNPSGSPCPMVNEGEFVLDRRGSDWIIQRHVIRECGVILSGPDPKSLIDPVSPDDIRLAVYGVLKEWWFPMLDDSTWLSQHGIEYHAFAVVSMCRALHAMKHGIIVSKPVAAEWARIEFGNQWGALIEKALNFQSMNTPDFLSEALEFIQFTWGYCNNTRVCKSLME